jgi:hypothetical protein
MSQEQNDICVCGHSRDEHGSDGVGHCGATVACRRGGCKKFATDRDLPSAADVLGIGPAYTSVWAPLRGQLEALPRYTHGLLRMVAHKDGEWIRRVDVLKLL